jgi:hypothetical protein
MGITINGEYTRTVAPVVHGMIDAHAYIHNCVATWSVPLVYLQVNAANEKEPIQFMDNETARDKLRTIDDADICYRTTTEIGNILVKLNSCMYNEENRNNPDVIRDSKKQFQIKGEIKKLLNGRNRKYLKDKEELHRLDDLEKEEKAVLRTLTNIYRKDIPSLVIVPTMDIEFAHIDGYEGETVYQEDKETGKIFYKRDGRKRYLDDDCALVFQTWNRQISDTEAAVTSNPLRLFPLFSYDPRRYRLSDSNDTEKRWRAWDEPFSRIVGSNKKEALQVWIGFCMNPSLGIRPLDELCEHLPKFYEKCEKENIPILANCTPTGIIMPEARYYKYKRKELVEKNNIKDVTSVYRGTERVVDDIDLSNFHMNYGHPRNWIPVLERYPKLRLCLSGAGGNSEWRLADWPDKDAPLPTREWIRCIIKLTAKYDNVYADLSGLNIYDEKIKNGLIKMLNLIQNDEDNGFKHLKRKLIFGSGWYHTYLTEVSDGGKCVNGRDDVKHSYGNYCREFKNLFVTVDKEENGWHWERISLINPWDFYALSEEKINKIYDELANIKDSTRVNRGLLEKMKKVFDGSEGVEGLVKYISRYNEGSCK